MTATTVGQLLVNAVLPEGLRRPDRVLDKKGLQALLQEVADRHPDKYAQVLYDLSAIGHRAATATGGYSFGLAHLTPSDASRATQADLSRRSRAIYADDSLTPDQRREAVVAMLGAAGDPLQDAIYKDGLAADNPIAKQVLSGARGNKGNLRSLLGGDLLYVDHRDRPIPVPVLRSYGQGLSPAEYLAGTFGARTGVIATKLATQQAGSLGKQLVRAAHRLVVTGLDADGDGQPDGPRGLPVPAGDPDNEGALLAAPAGGYERNTILTPKILADIRAKGVENLLVRSPLVGGPADGGVYARDVGVRERGGLAPVGDFVGIAAAQGAAEPLSQSQLCLAEGTLVRMADGTAKEVRRVEVGDIVLGADRTGNPAPTRVVRVHDNGPRPCQFFSFGFRAEGDARVNRWYGETVVCTAEHRVLTYSPHRQSFDTKAIGDRDVDFLVVQIQRGGRQLALPRLLVEDAGERATFDLEVEHPDHLFVLANGLVVSNSSKHSGGVAGAAKGVSGFKLIDQLTQVPATFPGGATHAQADGRITGVRPAPQGGHYVTVGAADHHVAQGMDPTVKVGDEVEAGDVLSEGLPNPAEIVRHKGIGEGRRYFAEAFRNAYAGAGIGLHRRNAELVARGLIDHVRLTEETDDHLPDDVVPYTRLEATWKPREGYDVGAPKRLLGHYLERPVLHYSIGTRLTPSVLRRLEAHGVGSVAAHKRPPPFEPEMVRGMETVSHDADWMTRFMGSYLQRSLLRGVHRGDESDEAGSSYVPALARGQDFGRAGKAVGFDPPVAPAPPGPRSVLAGLL